MGQEKTNGFMEEPDIAIEEIKWYRWRWFLILTFCFVYPVCLVIGLTGNVYGKHQGVVFKLPNKVKHLFLITGFVLMLGNILRLL
ncbi:hypothetical protein [Shewanella woodyi]|uniref:Uncharacterized protein n=1 Tax=Shewanella woodyi (strain ATCC 51908 / MS32) TaxID=392500 RepID=B1KNQ7_SHEWM|nr:hypothetical protein [Shewanella woodyi]ACA87515.1 hypothetical protein Swoo_3245 [Shewanella woodyi ATCC 51908]